MIQQRIIHSIAPSIYGHEDIKATLARHPLHPLHPRPTPPPPSPDTPFSPRDTPLTHLRHPAHPPSVPCAGGASVVGVRPIDCTAPPAPAGRRTAAAEEDDAADDDEGPAAQEWLGTDCQRPLVWPAPTKVSA